MAGKRARGANAGVAMAFSMAGYGTVPATGFRGMSAMSVELGETQDVLEDPSLGRGRNAQDGGDGEINNAGNMTAGVDVRYFGLHLKGLFGPPVTTQGLAATGSGVFSAQPANLSTITIAGEDVTFVTADGVAANLEVNIGTSLAETLANLCVVLNASADADIAAMTYRVNLKGDTLSIVHDTIGTAGNAVTVAASTVPASNATPSGATLTGGAATGPYNHVFTAGAQDLPDAAIELWNPEVPSSRMNFGVMYDNMSIQMQRGGLLNATFSLVAQGETEATTRQSGTLEAEWAWERFSQFSGYVEDAGVPLAYVQNATLRAANNLDRDESIRPDGRIGGADAAGFTAGLDLTVRFADTRMRDKANARESLVLRGGWTRGAHSLSFLMENIRLPRRPAALTSPGAITVQYPTQAFENQATQRSLVVTLVNDVASY